MKPNASDESKFRAVLLVAARARQIQSGAKPQIHTLASKATRIASGEFRADLIRYEIMAASNAKKTADDRS